MGHEGAAQAAVRVHNVPPSVEAGSNLATNVGKDTSFSGSFIDPGHLDTHTFHWDFGDDGIETGTLKPKHTYTKGGTYTVRLTVADDDSGTNSDTLVVTAKPMIYLPTVLKN